jgi:3-hydroxyacyl-[acyl-carrier-protein] dehydratase
LSGVIYPWRPPAKVFMDPGGWSLRARLAGAFRLSGHGIDNPWRNRERAEAPEATPGIDEGKRMNVQAGQTLESYDIQRLLSILPHRYPFLLVDRIIAARGDEFGIGIKNVTANEPQFQGHFPGRPVMPGVLLIEGMAQTAGALCIASQGDKPAVVYLTTVDKAKFRKPVVPGDRVEFHMQRTAKRRNMWWFRGEAKVDGVLVCEAEISATLVTER